MQFAQGHGAQLDLAPTLAVFASRFVISTPPRFARDYFADARFVISVETHRLRTSDAEHDEGASRKPSLHAIRESRIASSPLDTPAGAGRDVRAPQNSVETRRGEQAGGRYTLGAGSELVVLIFEQDVERRE